MSVAHNRTRVDSNLLTVGIIRLIMLASGRLMRNLVVNLFSEYQKREFVPALLLALLNGTVPREVRQELGNKEAVKREFASVLRDLTDAWIQSGKRGGVDCPFERTVPAQVGKFTAKHRPVIRLINGRVRYSVCSPVPSNAEDPESAARDYATYWFVHLLDSPERGASGEVRVLR